MHTTNPSLLERLRLKGEESAWERFVYLYTPFIFSLARRFGLDREASADVVQDVLLLLSKKMQDFEYDCAQSFRAWLRTVVMNRIYENARRRQVQLISGNEQVEVPQCEILSAFEEEEYRSYLVSRALEVMQRDFTQSTWKACWELVVNGRPAALVAAELGMTEGAVYVAKSRVLSRLRKELAGLL